MNYQKLISLFNQEKIRITEQVLNPIIDVLNDPKYDIFYNYFLLMNVNMQINNKKVDLAFIPYDQVMNLEKYKSQMEYSPYFEEVNKKILDIINFDPFKIVFGISNYQEWALAFYKFVLYSYYESKKLISVLEFIYDNSLNPKEYDLTNSLEEIIEMTYRALYGFKSTQIYSFDYWQNVTGIGKKQYDYFKAIVEDNNPSINLLNAFLYYSSQNKKILYKNKHYHEYKTFKPAEQIEIRDKQQAIEWITNYFACLTLNQKIQIGLWKAVQNLVFGTQAGNKVIVMRTISEINVNIKNVWKLDDQSLKFFSYLKFQSLFFHQLPPTFNEFINQDYQQLEQTIKPEIKKFKDLQKQMEE